MDYVAACSKLCDCPHSLNSLCRWCKPSQSSTWVSEKRVSPRMGAGLLMVSAWTSVTCQQARWKPSKVDH